MIFKYYTEGKLEYFHFNVNAYRTPPNWAFNLEDKPSNYRYSWFERKLKNPPFDYYHLRKQVFKYLLQIKQLSTQLGDK